MKRLLLLTLEYPPDRGGIATYLFNLHQGLKEVTVHRPRFFWPLWPRWLPVIWEAGRVLKKQNCFQLAISHVLPMGYVALILKWFFGSRYFVFVHGLDILLARRSFWKNFWLGRILNGAKTIIVNSRSTLDLVKQTGLSEKKIALIYPCLRTMPQSSATAAKDRFLLSVGRLVNRKNHRTILEIWPSLLRDFPDRRYVILGDGPELGKLKRFVQELGLASSVDFITRASDEERDNLYQQAEIFVLPTISQGDEVEGFGLVFLEAASYGKPVVAGRGGGVPEAVLDGQTGLIVDPENKDELLSALGRLLREPELARRLGQAGQERVRSNFLCQFWQSKLVEIYAQD